MSEFNVTVDLIADMATINPFDFFLEPEAETFPFAYDPILEQELAPFRKATAPGPELLNLLAGIPAKADKTVDLLVEINRMLAARIAYIVRLEPGIWSPEETLEKATGSCRDSAWVLVNLLRHLGFAARFVSGYLIQLVADQKPVEGPSGPTSDFTDLHAWAEVYLPGAGWIGFDVTSGLMAGEGHIPLAASSDPISAAPISGLVEKCETTFDFAMGVTRISETPRTTKPYDDATWQDILRAGARVDRALTAGDVRLSMGGEPTFVSASDMEAPEWTTEALGPTKRRLAGRLLRRLVPLWSPGAALQYGVGKHYPGEQLPRWALHAHWRRDGEPIWVNPELLATDDDRDTATVADAARFAAILAERLQIDPELVIQAYEDIHYFLWRESRLPANVLTEAAHLRDPLERARLARVFGQDWARPSAACCPCGGSTTATAAAGRADAGSSATARCSWCRATARSGFAYPWRVCPGPIRRTSPTRPSAIPSRRGLPWRRIPFTTGRTVCLSGASATVQAVTAMAVQLMAAPADRYPRIAIGTATGASLAARRLGARSLDAQSLAARSPTLSAPRWRSKPATASSMSSSRHSTRPRTGSTSPPPSRRPPRRWAERYSLKATRRLPTSGC